MVAPDPMLRLVLMRHGEAERGGADPDLSAAGRAAADAVAARLPDGVGRIVHSPLSRAVSTAERLRARWPAAPLATLEIARPEGDPEAVARALLGLAPELGKGGLLLVSHLPLLPMLHRWFTDEVADFAPASAVVLTARRELAWRGAFQCASVLHP